MDKLLTALFVTLSLTFSGQPIWQSLGDIPTKWIMVERDSLGYLVYYPCNGGTPMITLDSGYITIYWRLDGPSKLVVNKFTRLKGNRSFYISAANEGENIEINAFLKDGKQQLVLWKFAGNKWVMTPFENRNTFRRVDNPCPDEMKPEKEFLPVEF